MRLLLSLGALPHVASVATTHMVAAASATPLPLALAFSAGALTTLNPCGFALLPAYIVYVIRGGDHAAPDSLHDSLSRDPVGIWQAWRHTLRGGTLSLPLTAGFLLVFSVAGGVLALGGHALVHVFPWLALLVGFGLVALGGWMLLTRRTLEWSLLGQATAYVRSHVGSRQRGSAGNALLQHTPHGQLTAAWTFGLGYGLSSLGCALPIFLLVVGAASTATDLGAALLTLAAYAAGMALTLLAASLAASSLHDLMRRAVAPVLRWAQPLAALLLLVAGLYVIQFQLQSGLLVR